MKEDDWLASCSCCFVADEILPSLHWTGRTDHRADLDITEAKKNTPVPEEIGTHCRPGCDFMARVSNIKWCLKLVSFFIYYRNAEHFSSRRSRFDVRCGLRVALRQIFPWRFVVFCEYDSTNAPYSIHPSPTICKLSNWQRHWIKHLKHYCVIGVRVFQLYANWEIAKHFQGSFMVQNLEFKSLKTSILKLIITYSPNLQLFKYLCNRPVITLTPSVTDIQLRKLLRKHVSFSRHLLLTFVYDGNMQSHA